MDILAVAKDVLKQEAAALNNAAEELKGGVGEAFEAAVRLVFECHGKVVVTGVGKSGHIGGKIAATLASTGTPAFFLHPCEAMHGDLGMIGKGDVVIAISHSGSTSEILAILPHILRRGIKVIGVSRSGSELAKTATINIALDIQKEACILGSAPTTSTTLTLALGDALAVALMKLREFGREDFASFHPGGSLGKRLFLKAESMMRRQWAQVGLDANLQEAIDAMTHGQMGNVLIVDEDGRLVAILSDGDLRRALKDENFSLKNKALDYATKSPKVLKDPQILAYEALKMVEKHKIQLLVVVDENSRPVGVIHMHDLVELGL